MKKRVSRGKIYKKKHIFRSDQWRCMSWCLSRGIKIYIVPRRWDQEGNYVEIDNYTDKTRSTERYSDEEASLKIWELYCYYYDKNNSN